MKNIIKVTNIKCEGCKKAITMALEEGVKIGNEFGC